MAGGVGVGRELCPCKIIVWDIWLCIFFLNLLKIFHYHPFCSNPYSMEGTTKTWVYFTASDIESIFNIETSLYKWRVRGKRTSPAERIRWAKAWRGTGCGCGFVSQSEDRSGFREGWRGSQLTKFKPKCLGPATPHPSSTWYPSKTFDLVIIQSRFGSPPTRGTHYLWTCLRCNQHQR